jgi:hypothetical protein
LTEQSCRSGLASSWGTPKASTCEALRLRGTVGSFRLHSLGGRVKRNGLKTGSKDTPFQVHRFARNGQSTLVFYSSFQKSFRSKRRPDRPNSPPLPFHPLNGAFWRGATRSSTPSSTSTCRTRRPHSSRPRKTPDGMRDFSPETVRRLVGEDSGLAT